MDKRTEHNRRQQEAMLPRGLRVLKLREIGESWDKIAYLLGVTRQRAQALAKQAQRALENQ